METKKYLVRFYVFLHIREMIIDAKSRNDAKKIIKSLNIEGIGNFLQIKEVK